MSYENRIALGNLVPTIGQFKVMDKIPQYQQCEVHNLVEAPAEVPEVLRHVVFNIERGQTLHETIDFLNMCPDFKNMDIIYANELDDGAVRSGNCNVAYEIAKSIGMNYAYGLEFIELVNPNDNKGFHGNALFSRWPIRWAKVVHMPEQYNWYYDRQKRIGARVAIVCSLDIGGREVGAVSVHLENRADSEGREAQMAVVYDEIKKSFAPDTPVMIGGDLNTNTFDGNDIPGFTKLFNDPERLAKHMAAVEKYERVLPQAGGERLLLPRVQQHRRHAPQADAGRQEHAAQAGLADGARPWNASTTARSRLRRRTAPGPSQAARWRSSQVPSCPTTTPAGQTVDSQSNY